MYFSLSRLMYGAVPSTVTFEVSLSRPGATRVHRMIESGAGSPCQYHISKVSNRREGGGLPYRSYAMGELQFRWLVHLVPFLDHAGLDLGNIDAQSRVALGRASVVEIAVEARSGRGHPQGEAQISDSHGAGL